MRNCTLISLLILSMLILLKNAQARPFFDSEVLYPSIPFQSFSSKSKVGEQLHKLVPVPIKSTKKKIILISRKNNISDSNRSKRYAAVSQWPSNNITYKVLNYTQGMEPSLIDEIIANASKIWSEVADITLTPTTGNADIEISFESGDHGDGAPFDGYGSANGNNVLAHAFFPENGDIHFDDYEEWTHESDDGTNLFQVAVHEFGHALGLNHSDVKTSAVFADYAPYDQNFKLDQDDIDGIISIYGARSNMRDDQDESTTTVFDIFTQMITDTTDTYTDGSTDIYNESPSEWSSGDFLRDFDDMDLFDF